MSNGRALRLVGAASLAIVCAVAALPWLSRYRDEHAIMDEVRRLEGYLQAHDGRTWFYVERYDLADRADPQQEILHRGWLEDFERLSHLQGFAIANVVVQIAGHEALVQFEVRGSPKAGAAPAPAAAELRFRRQPDGTWRLVGERLVNAMTLAGPDPGIPA